MNQKDGRLRWGHLMRREETSQLKIYKSDNSGGKRQATSWEAETEMVGSGQVRHAESWSHRTGYRGQVKYWKGFVGEAKYQQQYRWPWK